MIEDRPDPAPEPGTVVVSVSGAGVNQADLLQRRGGYPAPPGSPADIPGLEFSGVVEAAGAGVGSPAVGDRVMGIVGGGAQAERLLVPAGQCAPVPAGVDLVAAGGIPEAFVTAHDALVTRAGLRAGERVLIHAVGSGVGTAAVQIAATLGAEVVGTSRTGSKLERARDLGLDHGVVAPHDLDESALAAAIRATGGEIDVVLDLVGGPYVGVDVAVAAPGGRIMLVSTAGGIRAPLSILTMMQRRLTMFGTVLRSRSVAEKSAAVAAFDSDLGAGIATGSLAPVIAAVVPLAEVTDAYERLAGGAVFGKIVLDCRS